MKPTLLALLFFFCSGIHAANVVGSHIGYRALDSVNYEITLTIYTDCSGSAYGNPAIKVKGKSSGVFASQLVLQSTLDITGLGPQCSVKSPCSGGSYAYGFLQRVYKTTVNISGGACQYVFSFDTCCRYSGITNGSANSNIYNEATINKCNGSNTSAAPSIPPYFLLPVGQDFIYSSLTDKNDAAHDSVSFDLGFLSTPPAFVGSPNKNLSFPAGFHLDSATGQVMFRPTKSGDVAAYFIETKEYRKVNGNMVLIGTTRMEALWFVISVSNKVPSITGQSKLACVGREVCVDIKTNDQDNNDTVTLNFYSGDLSGRGAVFTNTNGSNKNATGQVCWTPQKNDVSNTPYIFHVEARDNACASAATSRTFLFTVMETPDTSHFEIESKTVSCNEVKVKVKTKKGLPGMVYTISPISPYLQGTVNNSPLSVIFKDTGWNKFAIYARTNTPCISDPLIDSVYIPAFWYKLSIQVNNDTALCNGDSAQIFVQPLNGVGPYNYNWYFNPGTKNQQFITKPIETQVYAVVVIDSNRCGATDSVKVTVNQLPVVDAGLADTVCPGMLFTLEGSLVKSDAPILKYQWLGIDTGKSVQFKSYISRNYVLEATDSNGCKATDSVKYSVFPVKLHISPDTVVCFGGSTRLSASLSNAVKPIDYKWLTTGDSVQVITVKPLVNTDYIVKTKDAIGCELEDTISVLVNSITLNASADTSVCNGNTATLNILGTNGTAPFTYLWNDGSSQSSSTFTVLATTQKTVQITDKLGCIAYDTVLVTALENPSPFVGPDKKVCNNSSVVLKATSPTGKHPFIYLWTGGQTTDSLAVLFTSPQTIAVSITDANGCMGYDTVNIGIHTSTSPTFTPLPPILCNNGAEEILQASPAGGFWNGTGTVSGVRFNPSIAGSGSHTLTYNFIDSNNCPEKDSITAVVFSAPIPSYSINRDTGTVPFKVQFTNTTPGTTGWKWTIKHRLGTPVLNSTLQNPEITFSVAGEYDVFFEAKNDSCEGSITNLNRINAFNPVNNTGIGEYYNQRYSFYPNPASTSITIEGDDISKIEMYDLQGRRQQIIPAKASIKQNTIDITNLAVGIYILKINDNFNREYTIRVSIIH